ncbi:DUF4245 domain-containing protein [Allonocardiopsis opalescens]|uniref:Uncharacterized protein DUF4245 n=1 Tax=Allonocardiopsis opalescens TaxID=1144618 RepID=A0A2T0QDC2_9ACTN|nr:DUF4245 domain-containing protein [Allonocardiopsis opalescens]PRY01919.1 uncharacterized protein DUF4245 [Allonocardiopsis opalescens]
MSGAAGRARAGFGGFAVAFGLCALVGVLMAANAALHQPEAPPPHDYSAQLAALEMTDPFPVYAPAGLGPEWRPTASRVEGEGEAVTWRLGFATPQLEHASVWQAGTAAEELVAERLAEPRPDGELNLGGEPWTRYLSGDGQRRALAREAEGVTLVVEGTASLDELAELAGSLRPHSG